MSAVHAVVWEVWAGERIRGKLGLASKEILGTRLFQDHGDPNRGRLGRFRCLEVDEGDLEPTVVRLRQDWWNVKPWSVEVISGVENYGRDFDEVPANACEQTYLCGSGFGGVDALAAWQVKGGRGDGTKVVVFDVGAEVHQELSDTVTGIDRSACGDSHGTSVLGILGSSRELLGLVPEARLEFRQIKGPSGCERGGLAATNLLQLLEAATSSCDPGTVFVLAIWGQRPGVVEAPVEAWRCLRVLIQNAVAKGIHVVQAAGNIGRDIKDFVPRFADSGSIMVGAGLPHVPIRRDSSNYGKRVDLHQWGEAVIAAGAGPTGYRRFTGTSAATAIVAGVVASLAAILEKNYCNDRWKRPKMLRKLLRQTGYWHSPGIGPRPDLARVLEILARSGEVLTGNSAKNPVVRRNTFLLLVRRALRPPDFLGQKVRELRHRLRLRL